MDGTAGDIKAHVLSCTCVGLALDVRAAAHLADFEVVILFSIDDREIDGPRDRTDVDRFLGIDFEEVDFARVCLQR